MNELLAAPEVTEQLRRALRGEIAVRLGESTASWDEAYAGDVPFLFGDWKIVFFNDCDEVDYVACAWGADGRRGNCDSWSDAEGWVNPLDALSVEEQNALEQLLKDARP